MSCWIYSICSFCVLVVKVCMHILYILYMHAFFHDSSRQCIVTSELDKHLCLFGNSYRVSLHTLLVAYAYVQFGIVLSIVLLT